MRGRLPHNFPCAVVACPNKCTQPLCDYHASMCCTRSHAAKNLPLDEALEGARASERRCIVAWMRDEAARFRERDEGADRAAAAYLELLGDRIERGEYSAAVNEEGVR